MILEIDSTLKSRFPNLGVLVSHIEGVTVEKSSNEFEKFRDNFFKKIKKKYTIESLKDIPIFRAYRDFFWKIGIDPTKIRPAAEALIRRVLADKPIPKINNVVDAYNLASIETEIALAAFDEGMLKGELLMRRAQNGEKFFGIGMDKAIELKGDEIVVSDEERLIAIYPHRDAENTKVANRTKNVMILVCGVPGIDGKSLENARKTVLGYITKFCGGKGKIENS